MTHPQFEIVAICGSTRFMDQMADADRELTFAGHIVVKPSCDMKTPHPLWADPEVAEQGKQRLDALHRGKIQLATWVLVVGDYVGEQTLDEIKYARSLGKRVDFTHPEVNPTLTCPRCKGTAIDPEHSVADGIDGPAYLEPCANCCQHPGDEEAGR